MSFLDRLLGGSQQQQGMQDFVSRYEQGSPEEGYSDQEVIDRYQQVSSQVPNDTYVQAAQEAFSRLTPEQRMQFAQQLQQHMGNQSFSNPNLNRPSNDEQFQDPGFLAQIVGNMHEQQPGMLSQLLGGGSSGGQQGGMLSSPVAKAAMAGIAAMAVKKLMQGRGSGGI